MTTKQAITTLTEYNAWRRGADTEMIDPVIIREAIDKAIRVMASKHESVCPKCGNDDVIWTCYCNKCKEAH